MYLSVIICTYRRPRDLAALLDCLSIQTGGDFEILVVDGSGDDPAVRNKVEEFTRGTGTQLKLTLIPSAKGLPHQRNVGLEHARGEIICFLDDDVTLSSDFVTRIADLFKRPDMQNVGGVSGYDRLGYKPITLRWRLRCWLGALHSLEPGAADHLGRNVSLEFARPFSGCRRVGWLAGFCMIYRRAAISNLHFDDGLPTYAGEDSDFSIEVSRNWHLVVCGDLILEHHSSPTGRVSNVERAFQTGFGAGRSFAKRVRAWRDYFTIGWSLLVEFLIDISAFAIRPSLELLLMALARQRGAFAGFRSLNHKQPEKARAGRVGIS